MAQESELVRRLEATFRMIGKRVYLPSLRRLRSQYPGLDKVSYPLLAVLDEVADMRPSDLAAAVDLDLSTVSRHLVQLEQRGLISRRPDGIDRRASRITLTDTGREFWQNLLSARSELLGSALSQWTDDDRAQLLNLLTRLLADVAKQPDTMEISA
jgi:DNA-binding MarR family transcriptional regulator